MRSFKSRMFNFFVRHAYLLRGEFKKEVFTFNSSIQGFRDRCEKGANRYAKIPHGITVKTETIEGMKAEWLLPDGADSSKLILYVHGGGYVSGSCNDHRAFVSKFAKNTGVTCLIYEYRLAPEYPFPAAVDDSVKIWEWLHAFGYAPENIIVAGESAGGGLCLALLIALKDRKTGMPAAAVSISPWTDLTCSSESYHTKNKVSPAPLNSWTVFSNYYCGEHEPAEPLISPLFANLSGLPPILLNSAVNDELYDDGEKFARKAKEAGVEIVFRAGPGMIHCYPLMAPMFREATEAMDEIVIFVRKHLDIIS